MVGWQWADIWCWSSKARSTSFWSDYWRENERTPQQLFSGQRLAYGDIFFSAFHRKTCHIIVDSPTKCYGVYKSELECYAIAARFAYSDVFNETQSLNWTSQNKVGFDIPPGASRKTCNRCVANVARTPKSKNLILLLRRPNAQWLQREQKVWVAVRPLLFPHNLVLQTSIRVRTNLSWVPAGQALCYKVTIFIRKKQTRTVLFPYY